MVLEQVTVLSGNTTMNSTPKQQLSLPKTSYLGDAKHETKHTESKMAYSGVKANKHFEKWRSRSRDTVTQSLTGRLPRVVGESPVGQATYLQLK